MPLRCTSTMFCIVLCLTIVAFAQTGSIRGTVYEPARNNEPVLGASVTLLDTAYASHPRAPVKSYLVAGMTAGKDGRFQFDYLKPDTYLLHVTGVGWTTKDTTITVRDSSTCLVNVPLRMGDPIAIEDGSEIVHPEPLKKIRGKCSIQGRILDRETRKPIQQGYLTVSCEYAEPGVIHQWCCTDVELDSHGRYTLNNRFPGKYNLSPSARGYANSEFRVLTTQPDSVYTVDFLLTRSAASEKSSR